MEGGRDGGGRGEGGGRREGRRLTQRERCMEIESGRGGKER